SLGLHEVLASVSRSAREACCGRSRIARYFKPSGAFERITKSAGVEKNFSSNGSSAMSGKPAVLLLTGLLFACAPPPPAAPPAPPPAPAPVAAAAPAPTPAPVDRYVSIQGARCGGLMALQPDDRVEASMFYIGYMARRYGVRTVNVGLIPTMVRLASDYC